MREVEKRREGERKVESDWGGMMDEGEYENLV